MPIGLHNARYVAGLPEALEGYNNGTHAEVNLA